MISQIFFTSFIFQGAILMKIFNTILSFALTQLPFLQCRQLLYDHVNEFFHPSRAFSLN